MPSQQGGLDSLFPSLPEEAVEPGDTWELDEEAPFPLGDGVVIERGAGRFLRYGHTHGVTAAVLERRTTSSIDASASPGSLAVLSGGPDVPASAGGAESR